MFWFGYEINEKWDRDFYAKNMIKNDVEKFSNIKNFQINHFQAVHNPVDYVRVMS